jgi:hypothetical protein
MAYRTAEPRGEPNAVAVRPVQRGIAVALALGVVGIGGFGALLSQWALAAGGALAFGLPLAGLWLLRLETRVFDDRVEQGRLGRRALALAETAHVFEQSAARDPLRALTATSATLDQVLLVGHDGTRVTLSRADLPEEVVRSTTATALTAAVAAAKERIAAAERYADPDRLVGLDAQRLYGFRVGMTVARVDAPLADVVALDDSGRVELADGTGFSVGTADLVLWSLLRERFPGGARED